MQEVKDINRQKFLAELSKLLTFMYEDDRQNALEMYNRLFDECTDEQALLQYLMSPTRQAVILARAYDAKERKLQTRSQVRDDDDQQEETPGYVLEIEKIRDAAISSQIVVPAVAVDQISLFEEEASEGSAETSCAAPFETPSDTAYNAASEAAPAVNTESPSPMDDVDAFISGILIGDDSAHDSESEASKAEKTDLPTEAEAVDSTVVKAESADSAEIEAETVDSANVKAENAGTAEAAEVEETEAVEVEVIQTQSYLKANAALLILYVIIAIPVTLVIIALILVPAVLSLAISAAMISMGVLAISASFGGFIVFADIILILGAALVLLALGLLFLWIFIWFIGGAIVGAVRGIINLGKKWCFKEVSVNE